MILYGKNGGRQGFDDIIKINNKIDESVFGPGNKGCTKQVLKTIKLKAKNDSEFLNNLLNCINIYLCIMEQLERKKQ